MSRESAREALTALHVKVEERLNDAVAARVEDVTDRAVYWSGHEMSSAETLDDISVMLAALPADTPAPEPKTPGVWDIGDPEPEGVASVIEVNGDRDGDDSPVWRQTVHGQWKGYKNGWKAYLDWPELVRRWGPVRVESLAPVLSGQTERNEK